MEAKIEGPAQAAPPIPIDAIIDTFSLGGTWAMLLALLMASAEAIVLFMHAWFTPDPTTRITQIPEGIFCFLVAELNWRFIRRSRHRVAVNGEGIWSVQGGRTAYLAWRNLAHARANDALQRLELSDASRSTEIDVEYQLKNFEGLRDFILSHTAESAQVQSPGMSTFYHDWDAKVVFASLAAALFYISWLIHRQGEGREFLIPIVLGMVALIRVLMDPVSLSISHDGIAIEYLSYQSRIPFNSVTGITLRDVRRRANVLAGVVIATQKGQRIRLSRFREGSVALYEALQRTWRAGSGSV